MKFDSSQSGHSMCAIPDNKDCFLSAESCVLTPSSILEEGTVVIYSS